MNPQSKLKEIMNVLAAEDYEIADAVDKSRRYVSLSGQSIDATDAMMTFGPIYTKCKLIFETPHHDTTNLTGEHALTK